MSQFHPISTTGVRRRRLFGIAGLLLAASVLTAAQRPSTSRRAVRPVASADSSDSARKLPALPLFLDYFAATHRITVRSARTNWTGVTGQQAGFFARREAAVPLPGLIIIPDGENSIGWYENTAKEIAGIGYAVLLIHFDTERISKCKAGTFNVSMLSQSEHFPKIIYGGLQ
ncbi:MAG: hypothetical protein ABGZ35_00495 [Planctomycetaceae bacterium]